MLKVLVCTHGKMGEEMIRSVEMIGGKLKNTVAVSLLEEMSMDDYYEAVEKELSKEMNYLCLTDLFGGTPCNTLLNLSQNYKMEIICGVNLPVLLETSMADNFDSITELKNHLIEVYNTNGFDVLKKLGKENHGD